MTLVAVDPGVNSTGLAVFEDETLVGVRLLRAESLQHMICVLVNEEWPVQFGYPETVIVEQPTVYRRGGKGDSKDLISVAIVAGAAAAAYGCESLDQTIRFVEPRTWKGSVPKKVHNERILRELHKEERKYFDWVIEDVPSGLVHNMIDAVGIGLYELGRM